MIVYKGLNIKKNFKKSVIAIGNFDGLHKGHKKVLFEAKNKAKKNKSKFGVVTFEPVPVMFFNKKLINHRINNLDQKILSLKKFGLDFVIIVNFNKKFSNLSPNDFIKKILYEKLRCRYIFVSKNFRFGKNRKGNIQTLKINEKNFDLITIVHVLEHLDQPKENIIELKSLLSDEGVIYAEVPNLYGFPLGDEAHKIAFTQYSLVKMFHSSGYEIFDYGFTKTPKESIKFDYYHNNDYEGIFVVCGTKRENVTLDLPERKIPSTIKNFKYVLTFNYSQIMLKKISLTLLRTSLRYLRTFILFFTYGLIDFITLKIFRISFVSKFYKRKKLNLKFRFYTIFQKSFYGINCHLSKALTKIFNLIDNFWRHSDNITF